MPLKPNRPLLYLITSGATSQQTTSSSSEYSEVLKLTEAAVGAGIDLIQIREKKLNTRVLFELASHAAEITRGTSTQLLINDRADVAAGAGADGVHLTSRSLPVDAVRRSFGSELLIGVSTHCVEEAEVARAGGADFVVFGPVYEPLSKPYGTPVGVQGLSRVASAVSPLPVIALGGVDLGNFAECLRAGAAGVAAITMFNDRDRLPEVAREVRGRLSC